MNEEQAHFCSECGQRFAPATPQPGFQSPSQSAPDPVFPSFPPAEQSNFQQPQAVQDYQQSSGFGAPLNQQEPAGFGNPLGPTPGADSFGNPAPFAKNPASGFGPPQVEAPPSSGFDAPQSNSGFDAPAPGFNSPQPAVFNPPQAAPGFNPPQSSGFNPPASQLNSPTPSPGFSAPEPSGLRQPDQSSAFSPAQPSSNAAQEGQSQFPPQPQAPANPPLPARPKLHSPLFDGPDESDSRAQPPKSGFGGFNKPKGLRSPLLAEDDSEAEPPKPRSGGLRSPLLRGEDEPDHPQRGKGNQRSSLLRGGDDEDPPAPAKGKGGLRSPLLGASDDDFAQPKPARPPKGLPAPRPNSSHLRSPLLGGVDDFEGDDDDDLPPVPGKTAFPHVRRPAVNKDAGDHSPEPSEQASSGRFPGKGLRSPLLGDSDDDAPAARGGGNKSSTGGRPRLHSPIMDGPGSQNFESEYDEPYYEEIDDPNVLRSPLLAARSRHIAPPEPVAPPTPQAKAPAPPAQPPATFPDTNSFSEPPASATQPEFRDRGFPAPQPPGDMWRDRGFPEASRAPEPRVIPHTPVAQSSPPEVAPTIRESSPAPMMRRSSRSGLLGGGADDNDEQPINNYRNAPVSQPKPAMILIIPGVLAVLAKLWYMMLMGKALTDSMPFLADQMMQLIVFIALIIFAMTAGKK
jgi:hypothetical protein